MQLRGAEPTPPKEGALDAARYAADLSAGDATDQPARRAQEARVTVAWADELNAEWQAVFALHERHADRGHSAQRPERGEDGLARRGQPFGSGAGRGRRQDRVVALLEDLAEGPVHGAEARQRAQVIERLHVAPALDARAQVIRQAVAPLLPLQLEVHRHLGSRDDLVPRPRLQRRRKQLDFLDAIAQLLDQLGEGRLRVLGRVPPLGRLDEREYRRQRRLLADDLDEGNARARPRVGIALVERDERLRQQGQILDGAGEEADVI